MGVLCICIFTVRLWRTASKVLIQIKIYLVAFFAMFFFGFRVSKVKYFLTSSMCLTKCITKILNFFIHICAVVIIISFPNINLLLVISMFSTLFHQNCMVFFRRPNFDYILDTSRLPHMINVEMRVTALETKHVLS